MNGNGRTPTTLQVLRTAAVIGPLIGIFKSDDGKNWTRVTKGVVQDDLETTIAKLSFEHAIHSPNAWLKVIDQKSGETLHDQVPVVPPERIARFFPPVDDETQARKRAEWLERVLLWVLPKTFHERAKDHQKGRAIARWFARHKVAVQKHPDGSMRVMRNGEPIAEWLV